MKRRKTINVDSSISDKNKIKINIGRVSLAASLENQPIYFLIILIYLFNNVK